MPASDPTYDISSGDVEDVQALHFREPEYLETDYDVASPIQETAEDSYDMAEPDNKRYSFASGIGARHSSNDSLYSRAAVDPDDDYEFANIEAVEEPTGFHSEEEEEAYDNMAQPDTKAGLKLKAEPGNGYLRILDPSNPLGMALMIINSRGDGASLMVCLQVSPAILVSSLFFYLLELRYSCFRCSFYRIALVLLMIRDDYFCYPVLLDVYLQ